MRNEEHITMANRYVVDPYHKLPIVASHARGVYIWDSEGNPYLDMVSCYSADNIGHCHERIVRACCYQMRVLGPVGNFLYHDQLGPFGKEAAEFCGKEMVYPMNTGAEAWERAAIKISRKWAYTKKGIPRYKAEILVADNNFHGRTLAAISASSKRKYYYNFGPLARGIKKIPFGDAKALEKSINEFTAAFVIEPIQGEGGIMVPPEGYLRAAKEICQKNNILFVLDEIQTGIGRTGKKFAWQYEDAEPDLLILGKFLGGGLYPVSLVAGNTDVINIFDKGEDGSTFSANPIACAVAREVFRITEAEQLPEKAAKMGSYFMEGLKSIQSPYIKEVRGKGLLLGVELHPTAGGARKFCEMLLKEKPVGLICIDTQESVLRLTPPLIINQKEIDYALEKIEKVLGKSN